MGRQSPVFLQRGVGIVAISDDSQASS